MAGKKGSSGGIAVVVFAAIVLFNILRGSGHSWTYAPFLIVGAVVVVFAVNAVRTQGRRRIEQQRDRDDRIEREYDQDPAEGSTGNEPAGLPSSYPSTPDPSTPVPSTPDRSTHLTVPAFEPTPDPVVPGPSTPSPAPVPAPVPTPSPPPVPDPMPTATPAATTTPRSEGGELPAALAEKLTALQRSGRTVEAINELREATGMELYAASQYVRKLGKPEPLDTD